MPRTPFHQYHLDQQARFVDVAGWEMPASYHSPEAEHLHVRRSGGLFDLSHRGRIQITGHDAQKFLERILTRRIDDMKPNTSRSSLICSQHGGILDAVTVCRCEDHWLLVVSAPGLHSILAHLHQNIGTLSVTINDRTLSTAMVGLQGPKVIDLISQFSSEVPNLQHGEICVKNLFILRLTITRRSFTGEDGVEVVMGANMATTIVKLLSQNAPEGIVAPIGLEALNTLRIEAGVPMLGHEFNEQTDPLSAGLEFAITPEKADPDSREQFIGSDALKMIASRETARRLVGLKLTGSRQANQGASLFVSRQIVGAVTSGCISPTLNASIAMAFIDTEHHQVGNHVGVEIDGDHVDAQVVPLPFYESKFDTVL